MNRIERDEKQLVGRWEGLGGRFVADPVAKRIDALVADNLIRVTASADGWSVLYRDPEDGRLWELTHPESELPGGGPPTLTNLTEREAHDRFAF